MADTPQHRAIVYARQSAGSAKSLADQVTECRSDADEQGWTVTAVEQDGISASRFAAKTRDAWPRVVSLIEAGDLDVLVLWESSRGDRDAETWLGLLRRCRIARVRIRITSHERTYDLRIPADWKQLASEGVDGAYEAEKISLRTRRGVAAAAKAGRPAMGPTPYGYKRRYDPDTGKLAGQEPDPTTAPIVVDIIKKVSRAVPLSEITKDLNDRGVPAPRGGQWRRLRVRDIATNPAYLGLRRHHDQTYPAGWDALVDEDTFYAAARVLTEPTRLAKARPGRQIHLLTYLAVCDTCGTGVHARSNAYVCPAGHVWVARATIDDFVVRAIEAGLSRPDAYTALRQAGAESDRDVLAARNEAAQLRQELDGWRLSAARKKTSAESLAVIEADLLGRIADAERREKTASLPPALRRVLEPGADVHARIADASLAAKREIIRSLAEIRLSPAGQNSRMPARERLGKSRWLDGDGLTWGEL